MLKLELPLDLAVDLAAVVDVVAATIVTTHVLLNKRDVRSSIGWIGIAWLSPILGSAMYYLFGINRVGRRMAGRRRQIERSSTLGAVGADPGPGTELSERARAIARVGDQLAKNTLLSHNTIDLLRNGDEAYPAMLQAIRSARCSIALASYIFRADTVGLLFVEALSAARARGVEIRVLVDGVGSGYFFCPAANALRKSGVRVEHFLHEWLPWRMPFLNMRNHKKLLIVDGAVEFTGGLNLGAENLSRFQTVNSVEDTHFKICGPAASMLMQSFAQDWSFTCGEELIGAQWWPTIAPSGSAALRGVSSGPDYNEAPLEAILAAAVGSSQSRLRILTPYFLPDQRLISDIALASLRGANVEIVIPARSNHMAIDWAMRSQLSFFGVPSLAVYLSPAPFDHSKIVTVDGVWAGLGSPNWDLRSTRLNFEFMLECYDPLFISGLDKLVDERIARSERMDIAQLHDRSVPIKLRDAVARLFLPYL